MCVCLYAYCIEYECWVNYALSCLEYLQIDRLVNLKPMHTACSLVSITSAMLKMKQIQIEIQLQRRKKNSSSDAYLCVYGISVFKKKKRNMELSFLEQTV